MIDFEGILNELFNMGIIIAAVVARRNGEIVYTSSNWSVEPSDIAKCVKQWQAKGQYVNLQGVKYSCLLNEVDYFSGTNYKEKTWLFGAASPIENDERYYVLGYGPAGINGTNAYVDVTRAANRMKEAGSYMDASAEFGKYDEQPAEGGAAPAAAGAAIDPALKQEIDGFIQWIRDPNGLSGYIKYYLDNNDANVLGKLSQAYNSFRQVFGF
jgi:hypothetical protein